MKVSAADKSAVEEGNLCLLIGLAPDGVLDFVDSLAEFSPVNGLDTPRCRGWIGG